ncbi:MAG: tetratricopeptide repeat protein [Kofleriaceae bacterium]
MRALIVVAVFAATSTAYADVTKEFQAGVDAFRLGKYAEAIEHLEAARKLDPKLPGPHRFLAAVAHAQSKWADCVDHARKALALNPISQELADTRKLHDDCRASDGRSPFRGELGEGAAIAVTANVQGAMVKIRGLTYGGTPLAPRPIAPGRLAIDVEKFGYLTVHTDIDALPGVVTDLDVTLERGEETGQAPVKPRSGWLVVPPGSHLTIDGRIIAVTADGRIKLAPGVRVVEITEAGKDPWRRRVAISAELDTTLEPVLVDSGPRESKRRIGYLVAGGGVALLGLGVGAFYISRNAIEDAKDILRVEQARPIGEPAVHTRADFEAARDKANRWSTISNLAYGAGFVAGGIGAYLWYRNRAPSDDTPEFALAPVAGGAVVTRSAAW